MPEIIEVFGGGISIFRRKAIEDIGGITRGVDTGEDYDLARKLSIKGYTVVFYDEPVYHDSHKTLEEFLKKDLRRSKSFKKLGLSTVTGISFKEHLFLYFKTGFFISLKNFYMSRKLFFGIVPLIVFLRLLIYLLIYLVWHE